MAERSDTQPNPGWGKICESCAHRDRTDLEHADMPCKKVQPLGSVKPPGYKGVRVIVPDLVRYTCVGTDWENCPDFQSDGDDDGENVPFELLCLGARFRYDTRKVNEGRVWVKIGPNEIAEWDSKHVSDRWIGQRICCFSDTDDLSEKVTLVTQRALFDFFQEVNMLLESYHILNACDDCEFQAGCDTGGHVQDVLAVNCPILRTGRMLRKITKEIMDGA